MPKALLLDDDANFVSALAELVEGEGYTARIAGTIREARAELARFSPDVVLVDLFLPDGSGLEFLAEVAPGNAARFVIMTGFADSDSVVQALRHGAADYLTKPLDIGRLKALLNDFAGVENLPRAPRAGEAGAAAQEAEDPGLLIGESPEMVHLRATLLRVAPTDASVMLVGESGTGKELAAETVHLLSRRSKAPYLPLNCGAISPTLIESELFGHESGSFTGADRRHKGYFERAHRGTLFLDEITEMPIELQVKLLRVLETGVVVRIGGDSPVDVDVRVVAATNRDLDTAVREGKLREDLLYRLAVFPVHLPPLRERGRDVDLLAAFFLDQLNQRHETAKAWTPEALERLRGYAWPGNVRELRNWVHHAFIMADDEIAPRHLLRDLAGALGGNIFLPVGTSLEEAKRRLIAATLKHTSDNKRSAAELLGISVKTLYNHLHGVAGEGESAEGDVPGSEGPA
ncbi:MAG: sigma-54-dependent transcriptional regulator [Thermoanaerobaculia bacterium]